ncbi:MAG: transcriptional regulator, partial [Ruminococcus sp.]|nr:transcriptional regulator [Ruminococcus sp.]
AEENIMNIMREKEESIRKIIVSVIAGVTGILSGCTLILVSSVFNMETWQRGLFLAIGIIVMIGGIAAAAIEDMTAGTYECKNCGTRFVPSAASYLFGVHTITRRKLTCPKCSKRSYCRRRLTH